MLVTYKGVHKFGKHKTVLRGKYLPQFIILDKVVIAQVVFKEV